MLPDAPSFDRNKTIHLFTVIFYVLLAAVGLYAIFRLRDLIAPFFIAITIAVSLAPEIDRMQRRGWKRTPAILVIYLLFIAVFVATMLILVPFLSGQIGQLAQHLIPASVLSPSSTRITSEITHFMKAHRVPDMVQAPIIGQAKHIPVYLSVTLTNLATQLPIWAGSLLWVILVPVLAFYFLSDYHTILGKTLLFVRPEKRLVALGMLNDIVAVFGNYVRGMFLMVVVDIVVIFVALKVLRVPYAETVATLAGILYAIPYVGAVISTILICLVAWSKSATLAAITLFTMIFIQQILFDQIVVPRLLGKQVGLHPLWAITAMLIGGELMGIGGTLLAVPLAAGIQVVLVHVFPRLKDDDVAILSERYLAESDKKAKEDSDKTPNAAANFLRRRRRKHASTAVLEESVAAPTPTEATETAA